jgi:hypothetical protein
VSKRTDEKHPGGIPYLIVPFRWGTPNNKGGKRAHFSNWIPRPAFRMLRIAKMEKSVRTGEIHAEKNYWGKPVDRNEYQWADRLETEGNMNGMVHIDDETTGKGTYFTFRIISASSPKGSWIRKAVDPIDVESALEKATRPAVEEMIQAGFEADIGVND